jgi:membrane protein
VAIDDALAKAYGKEKSTKYIFKRLKAMFFTIILLMLIIVAILFIVFGNNVMDALLLNVELPAYVELVLAFLRYMSGSVIVFIFFLFLYNMAPGKLSFARVLPGTLFASIGLVLISAAISVYVKYAVTLTFLYGSLTSVIVLLIWLYATSYIIILGGEFNAMNQFNKERKTENNQSSSMTTSS